MPVSERMRVSTCTYIISDHKWLMLLRNKKQKDVNAGKWIGVGGKLETGESPEECAVREIREETGLFPTGLRLRGTLDFHYDGCEDEKIYVYTADGCSGEMTECPEGTLAWIAEEQLLTLELWEGDRLFLAKLLSGSQQEFGYDLFYDDKGNLLSWKETGRNIS